MKLIDSFDLTYQQSLTFFGHYCIDVRSLAPTPSVPFFATAATRATFAIATAFSTTWSTSYASFWVPRATSSTPGPRIAASSTSMAVLTFDSTSRRNNGVGIRNTNCTVTSESRTTWEPRLAREIWTHTKETFGRYFLGRFVDRRCYRKRNQ